MKNDPNILYVIMIFSLFMFFAGKACGRDEFAERIEVIQERVAKVEERMTKVEYPEGEKRYFWPKR